MSTEATGDGQPDAVGAVEPDVAAGGAELAATAVAEPGTAEPGVVEASVDEGAAAGAVVASPTAWDTGVPSAWGAPDEPSTSVESVESVEAGEAAQADDALVADEASDPGESPEAGEAAETNAAVVPEGAVAAPVPEEAARVRGPFEAFGGGGTRESAGVDEAVEPDESEAPGEDDDEPNEPDDADEADEAAEPAEDAEDHEGGESPEDDDALEYDEGYEEYDEGEPEEVAKPKRARRWPRVLLALGFVVLAVAIVGGAIAIVGSVTHGFKKPVKVTYKKSALFSLKTGECFDPQGQSYSLVSCDSPHEAEVFATFTLSGTKWPGATAIAAAASSGCAGRLTGYLNPQLAISLASTYVYPDSVAWQAGTKTVICEVRASAGELTGSVRAASASAS